MYLSIYIYIYIYCCTVLKTTCTFTGRRRAGGAEARRGRKAAHG